ncbi:MAG: tRNA-intron lyase, partial [Candidatus Hodarchaeota archaeon]
MPEKIETEFIDNFLVVWNPQKGSELYRLGFYGKPIGIPKPKALDFDVPLMLDLMEGLYLVEKGSITVFEGSERKRVSFAKLRRRARKLYEEF